MVARIRARSAKTVPPFTALILDEEGKPLPPNTEGRLYFKDETGRGVVYHNDPEKSKAAHVVPGYVHAW